MRNSLLTSIALNDVFFSQSDQSRSLTYALENLDEYLNLSRIRSSGLLLSTGTGSTAWLKNMNKLGKDQISQILKILIDSLGDSEQLNASIRQRINKPNILDSVHQEFNRKSIFDP